MEGGKSRGYCSNLRGNGFNSGLWADKVTFLSFRAEPTDSQSRIGSVVEESLPSWIAQREHCHLVTERIAGFRDEAEQTLGRDPSTPRERFARFPLRSG